MSSFMDFLLGKGEKTKQFDLYTPEQKDYFSQILSRGGQMQPQGFDYLESILSQDPEMMKQFERPAMRQFEEEVIPGIAERFTGQFGEGSQQSSAFGQQLGKAGAGLSERLAAQRGQMGMGAISQLQNMLSPAMGRQFETMYQPQTPGFLQELLSSLLKAAPSAVGGLF